MNVRLRKNFIISALVANPDRYDTPIINQYHVDLYITTLAENSQHMNVAYNRINYWLSEVFENSLLIDQNNERRSAYESAGLRCIAMPEEPVDQLIGILLYCKLNAICENRLTITDVEISSPLDDYITYLHCGEENLGPLETQGWWHDSSPNWSDVRARGRTQQKIINLNRRTDWSDLGLDWEEKDATIVVADFNKDEDK